MTSKLVTIFSQNVFQRMFCDKAVKMLAVKKKIYMKKWCNDVSGHNACPTTIMNYINHTICLLRFPTFKETGYPDKV